ncbi:hypothetical protein ACET3Z_031599 [Daucus carota]
MFFFILQFKSSVQNREHLNLNGGQRVSDKGVEAITYACPKFKSFSIYWNVRCLSTTPFTGQYRRCEDQV